jgi:hypothetical protein
MWPLLLLAVGATAPAADDAPPNFADHVSPVLRENCVSCHRGSRARNGLDLRSVKSILKGGSAGPAVVPGDSSGSLLYQVIAHEAEPFMPPDEDALEPAVAQLVAAWIDGGARADAKDKGAAPEAAAARPVAPPLPSGKAPMPEGLATQPVWWTDRGGAVMAVAASPGAPLAAVAGYRQVSLYGLPGGELLGVLPFEPGQVHSLRFSAGGETLIVGGGRSADSGRAVAYEVATGRAWATVGDEPDVVLDADISVDLQRIALGGPDRTLRVYGAATGELAFEGGGHTDWVTAVAFSPDGVLVASGDRAGGLFVREAMTGEEFHRLPAVDGGVTSLSWRADSMVLAAAGEGGKVALFEMENGKRIKNFSAGSGVLDLQYGRSGGLASAGRDGRFRVHDGSGKERAKMGPAPAPGVSAAISGDGRWILGGDSAGQVHLIEVESRKTVATLSPFPATDEARSLEAAEALEAAGAAALLAARERFAEAEAGQAGVAEAAGAARREAEGAAARAAEAREAEAAAVAALRAAEDKAAGFEPVLLELSRALTEADGFAELATSRKIANELVLAERVAELDLALLRQAEARGPAVAEAEAAVGAARERMEGATALLQLAAGEAARAAVLMEQRRAQLVRWRERAEPRVAALEAARTASEAASVRSQEEAQGAQAAAERAAAASADAQVAAAALEAAGAALESAERDATAHGAALNAARRAHGARREDLMRSGGEVRPLPGD